MFLKHKKECVHDVTFKEDITNYSSHSAKVAFVWLCRLGPLHAVGG